MRWLFVSFMLLQAAPAGAQHCPWDCSGMILFTTSVSPEKVYKLFPVIVDENKKIIIDTIYGTGLPTYDTCKLLYYDDYVAYRTPKIKLHYWYGYDTIYYFGRGHYIIRINFCRYNRKKLFLRLTDPDTAGPPYRYIRLDSTALFHLHDYSREINSRNSEAIKAAVAKFVIHIDCAMLRLKEEDCQ